MSFQFILLDIEGTTTDIRFVHDVLFPYSYERLPAYAESHQTDHQLQACLKQAMATVLEEERKTITSTAATAYLLHWIKTDRKHPALKTLQGLIWQYGFEHGDFQGHVYPEVPVCFQAWQAAGLKLGIYSSGSVQAQKLLFRYSVAGDLTSYLSAYFDTAVGGKKEPQSYATIARQLGLETSRILFVSDVGDELAAAQAVGIQVRQSCRPGITPDVRFEPIHSFSDIPIPCHSHPE